MTIDSINGVGVIFGVVLYIYIILFLVYIFYCLYDIFIRPLLPEVLMFHGEIAKRKIESRLGHLIKHLKSLFFSITAAFGVWFLFIIGWLIYSDQKLISEEIILSVTCISFIVFILAYIKEIRRSE